MNGMTNAGGMIDSEAQRLFGQQSEGQKGIMYKESGDELITSGQAKSVHIPGYHKVSDNPDIGAK